MQPTVMTAAVVHSAGDLRTEQRPVPEPGPGEVLIAMEFGGICGSDLAYYRDGTSGTARLRAPLILGHEVAGRIAATGPQVPGLAEGSAVAVHPATFGQEDLPANLSGRTNLHHEVRYLGSAAPTPHQDGGFCQYQVVHAAQLRALPATVSTRHGAVAEPFGVALHAVHRAGPVAGRTVLVNGAGPIGALCVAAARARGAQWVVAADVVTPPLQIAAAMGADEVRNLASGDDLPAEVDVAIEATGHSQTLAGVLAAVTRGGTVVQVGNLPLAETPAVLADLVTREIDLRGSYRFIEEISEAIELMAGQVDVEPLLTHTFGIEDAVTAFDVAADRSTGSSKVLLDLR